MIKVLPPKGLVNPTFGGRTVPPDGIDVSESQGYLLLEEGWTLNTEPKRELEELEEGAELPESE